VANSDGSQFTLKIIMLSVVEQTQAWLNQVIIAYNICPFARAVAEKNLIHYQVDEAITVAENLTTLIAQAEYLDQHDDDVETSLLIYPQQFAEFEDFVDYVALADELLIMQGYEGIYQLASFHPHYCFAEADSQDAANYTNRSPYPMLHLIRERSIENALQHFPHPESIPERNITLTRQLGLAKMQALLAACIN
jgi:hypothetical protein